MEGGRSSRTVWAMWWLLRCFEHRDDVLNLSPREWSLSWLRKKQRDSSGAFARRQGKIMWPEPKECQ